MIFITKACEGKNSSQAVFVFPEYHTRRIVTFSPAIKFQRFCLEILFLYMRGLLCEGQRRCDTIKPPEGTSLQAVIRTEIRTTRKGAGFDRREAIWMFRLTITFGRFRLTISIKRNDRSKACQHSGH